MLDLHEGTVLNLLLMISIRKVLCKHSKCLIFTINARIYQVYHGSFLDFFRSWQEHNFASNLEISFDVLCESCERHSINKQKFWNLFLCGFYFWQLFAQLLRQLKGILLWSLKQNPSSFRFFSKLHSFSISSSATETGTLINVTYILLVCFANTCKVLYNKILYLSIGFKAKGSL